MAQGFSAELVGVLDGTLPAPGKADGRVHNAKVREFVATLDLSKATVAKNSGDTNVLCRIPQGYKVLSGSLLASATMGTATVAIGVAGTPGKYRAAAVFTAVDTPTAFMTSAAMQAAPLAAYEDVILTVGTAALPGTGFLHVIMRACAR